MPTTKQSADHALTSASKYRKHDAELVRQEADEELAEWRRMRAQPRARSKRVSTSRTA